jgi:hypothetical protein
LAEDDWAGLRFSVAAGFAMRPVRHDLAALWHGQAVPGAILGEIEPHQMVVWRKALQPHFRMLDRAEWAVLDKLASGKTFGEAGTLASHPELLGGWLAQWLTEGLFAGFTLTA